MPQASLRVSVFTQSSLSQWHMLSTTPPAQKAFQAHAFQETTHIPELNKAYQGQQLCIYDFLVLKIAYLLNVILPMSIHHANYLDIISFNTKDKILIFAVNSKHQEQTLKRSILFLEYKYLLIYFFICSARGLNLGPYT